MPESRRYQCLNCGHRFTAEVLTREEVDELEREFRRAGPVRCPECKRTDLRPGW